MRVALTTDAAVVSDALLDARSDVGAAPAADGGCAEGLMICPSGDGSICVDLQTDRCNCGRCGAVCRCERGQCVPVCSWGLATCPGPTCREGLSDLCVDLDRDEGSCGACGHSCEVDQSCIDGICVDP